MKKQNIILLFVFLMIISGKVISQPDSLIIQAEPTTPNGLPLYQTGKLYFQLKSNSNVLIRHKDTILNDVGGSFHTLFAKYQVSKTERPFAILNTAELNKTYRISFNQIAKIDSFIIELSQISSDVEY